MIAVRALEPRDLDTVLPMLRDAVPALRLDTRLLEENVLRDPGSPSQLLNVALDDGALIGVACGTTRLNSSDECPASRELRGHVKLLAVDPAHRRRGIGRLLVAVLERHFTELGAVSIETDGAAPRYLQPGVPSSAQAALAFFRSLGFEETETRESLVASLEKIATTIDTPTEPPSSLAEAGISLRRASLADANAVCPQIASAFSSNWAEEVAIALERSPPAVHLAVDTRTGDLAGFVCVGLWAHNAFGPMGVVEAFGGRGIGMALTTLGLRDLAGSGETNAVISWIGPEAFYRRIVPVTTTLRFPAFRKAL